MYDPPRRRMGLHNLMLKMSTDGWLKYLRVWNSVPFLFRVKLSGSDTARLDLLFRRSRRGRNLKWATASSSPTPPELERSPYYTFQEYFQLEKEGFRSHSYRPLHKSNTSHKKWSKVGEREKVLVNIPRSHAQRPDSHPNGLGERGLYKI